MLAHCRPPISASGIKLCICILYSLTNGISQPEEISEKYDKFAVISESFNSSWPVIDNGFAIKRIQSYFIISYCWSYYPEPSRYLIEFQPAVFHEFFHYFLLIFE